VIGIQAVTVQGKEETTEFNLKTYKRQRNIEGEFEVTTDEKGKTVTA